jgi:hypothetical protein
VAELSRAPRRLPALAPAAAALAAVAVAALVVMLPLADVLGIAAMGTALAVVFTVAWRVPAVRMPLLVAFALRTLASLVQAYVMELPGAGLDAVSFERIGYDWSRDGVGSLLNTFGTGALLYSWIIAVLYALFDRSTVMIQTVNVLFGTLIVYNCFLMARFCWGERVAVKAAWTAALFPTMILFSAITLREIAVGYPLTLGAYFFARWRQDDRPADIGAAILCFGMANAFHTAVIGVMGYTVFAVVARTFGSLARGDLRSSGRTLVGMAVVGVVVVGVVAYGVGSANPLWYLDAFSSPEQLRGQQMGGGLDRTDYLRGMVTNNLSDLVWQTPIRLTFFLFMPFPWLVRAVVDIVGLVDSLLYMSLAFSMWRARKLVWASRPASGITGLLVSTLIVFGLVVSNYGTAIRHRAKIAPLFAAVACVGMGGAAAAARRGEGA